MKFGSSNDTEKVKEQYATSKGLNVRLLFHDMYSTNKLGYGNWLISKYEIPNGSRVLELGCGTGSLWMGRDEIINRCEKLILTDLSEGMIETAKKNLGDRNNIEYRIEDIQKLDFKDKSFDIVVANSMLYHVPDIKKALEEVRRVLKDGGVFYCSTYGENNFTDKLAEWFSLGGEELNLNHNFTMQNGGEKLKKVFNEVNPVFYEDSLHITNVDHLIEYFTSLASFKVVANLPISKIRNILMAHVSNGAIDLPKEYGVFICK